MITVLEHPVVVDPPISLPNQLVVSSVIVVVVVWVAAPMRFVVHGFRPKTPLFGLLVRVILIATADETIPHRDSFAIPENCGPEVTKCCDLCKEAPQEREEGDDGDKEPVHGLERRNARVTAPPNDDSSACFSSLS